MDDKNTNAGKISIFSGRSNQLFSEKIAESADIPLGHVEIKILVTAKYGLNTYPVFAVTMFI